MPLSSINPCRMIFFLILGFSDGWNLNVPLNSHGVEDDKKLTCLAFFEVA